MSGFFLTPPGVMLKILPKFTLNGGRENGTNSASSNGGCSCLGRDAFLRRRFCDLNNSPKPGERVDFQPVQPDAHSGRPAARWSPACRGRHRHPSGYSGAAGHGYFAGQADQGSSAAAADSRPLPATHTQPVRSLRSSSDLGSATFRRRVDSRAVAFLPIVSIARDPGSRTTGPLL